jgi:hypothetical protein
MNFIVVFLAPPSKNEVKWDGSKTRYHTDENSEKDPTLYPFSSEQERKIEEIFKPYASSHY